MSAKRLYVRKIHHKYERHLRLVAHSFTKLSQNVCLINIHILIYWHAGCDCKLWNALWFYCDFCVFQNIIDDHSFLNCFYSYSPNWKHSQRSGRPSKFDKTIFFCVLASKLLRLCFWEPKWLEWNEAERKKYIKLKTNHIFLIITIMLLVFWSFFFYIKQREH